MGGLVARLGDQPVREHEGDNPNRDVDEEDPRPREVLGDDAAEDEPDRGATDRDRSPDAEGTGALSALLEGRRDDRQRGRCDQRSAEALEGTGADQHALACRKPVEQRGAGEDDEADEEEPLAAEQVAKASAEQQEAAEDEGVGVDDPLQAAVGEVEIGLDRGQRDVHDRRVEDDHELGETNEDEDDPGVRGSAPHGSTPFVQLRKFFHRCKNLARYLQRVQICI